jgi:hypothetical protein
MEDRLRRANRLHYALVGDLSLFDVATRHGEQCPAAYKRIDGAKQNRARAGLVEEYNDCPKWVSTSLGRGG